MKAAQTVLLRACLSVMALAACGDSEPRRDTGAASRLPSNFETEFRAYIGRTWALERMGDQAIAAPAADGEAQRPGRPPEPGNRPTLRFTATRAPAGSVHPTGTLLAGGRSFCNTYGTAYTLGSGSALRFYGFESTLVGCNGPDSLETRFFRGLAATRNVMLDSARLALIAEDGTRLTFVLLPDSAEPPGR